MGDGWVRDGHGGTCSNGTVSLKHSSKTESTTLSASFLVMSLSVIRDIAARNRAHFYSNG